MSSETSEWIDSDSPFKPIETWGSEMIRAAVWGFLAVIGSLALLIPVLGMTAAGIAVGQSIGMTGDSLGGIGTIALLLGVMFDAGFVFYFIEG